MQRLYIAYGSNMNLEQMRHRCPHSRVVGTAMLKDHELLFRGVATVEPKPGGQVPVLAWDITAKDEKALDLYEGWPRLYRKEDVEIELDGKPINAMVYIMNDGHSLSPPGKGYYNTILDGYQSAGFDKQILDDAVHESTVRLEEMPEPEPQQMRFNGMDSMNWW